MKVYLAGPMCGCDSRETYDWRDDVAEEFEEVGIEVFDPSTGLDFVFAKEERLLANNEHHGITNKEVFQKDIFMIEQCDVLLVNLHYQNGMSTGCFFEMGYAYSLGMPIIVVNAGAKKDHPFIDIPALNLDTLDEAIEYVKSLDCRNV